MMRRLLAAVAVAMLVAGPPSGAFAGQKGKASVSKAEKAKSAKSVKAKAKAAKAKAAKAKAKAKITNAYTVPKGTTTGPLTVTNPPYDGVINYGTITNDGQNGVPALSTEGNMTVINNGSIIATSTSTSSAKATGVFQGN